MKIKVLKQRTVIQVDRSTLSDFKKTKENPEEYHDTTLRRLIRVFWEKVKRK